RQDKRSESQSHAVWTKLNRHRRIAAAGGLNHREGEFAAGEKRCLFSAYRGQCRLCENLNDLLILEGLNGCSNSQSLVVIEHTQKALQSEQRRTGPLTRPGGC